MDKTQKAEETNAVRKLLSMDEMLAVEDVKYGLVPWGDGDVRVGSLDAESMIEFVESNNGPAKKTAGVRLLIKSLVDKDGNRIGDEKKHLQPMLKKSAAAVNAAADAILKLNGFDKKAQEAAKNDSSVAPSDATL